MTQRQPLRIGIIAAEPSADLLAAGLMDALRHRLPQVSFEGIAGPLMRQSGIDVWEDMDSISVMGLVEVVPHLRRLLQLRARILQRWRDTPPAAFIGVDAPDFNLTVEMRLREQGVPTVHYVSPTVWVWRTGRVRKMRRAIDLLLTIFPFEGEFLQRYGMHATYVGHPLAWEMPLDPDKDAALRAFDLDPSRPVLAVLPGSRRGEVSRIAPAFVETAQRLQAEIPGLQVVLPLINATTRDMLETIRAAHAPGLECTVSVGDARVAMAAADVVLVASGTATLECLLSKRPMVVGYKVSPATYRIVRLFRLLKVKHVALSNLLAGEGLAPELIQDACTPDRLVPALKTFFDDADTRAHIAGRYRHIHEGMRMDTNSVAADAVIALLKERGLVS
ncbi:MAG: lipid-A-disaccharide synthase [Gammaproteobacteria bacterium]|nr:lipid-A-disaccharide synthase [Gammaproteobacteria bacterium]